MDYCDWCTGIKKRLAIYRRRKCCNVHSYKLQISLRSFVDTSHGLLKYIIAMLTKRIQKLWCENQANGLIFSNLLIAERISARQLIRVHMSAMRTCVRTYVRTYVVSRLGMRMSRLGMSNVTFRNAA